MNPSGMKLMEFSSGPSREEETRHHQGRNRICRLTAAFGFASGISSRCMSELRVPGQVAKFPLKARPSSRSAKPCIRWRSARGKAPGSSPSFRS